jgi:hypothetical protein
MLQSEIEKFIIKYFMWVLNKIYEKFSIIFRLNTISFKA